MSFESRQNLDIERNGTGADHQYRLRIINCVTDQCSVGVMLGNTGGRPVICNNLFIVKFSRQVAGGFKPEKLNKDFFSQMDKVMTNDQARYPYTSPVCSECYTVMFYMISLHNRESGNENETSRLKDSIENIDNNIQNF